MSPEEYVKIREKHFKDILKIKNKIKKLEALVDNTPPMDLIQAVPIDIQVGALVWIDGDDGFVWKVIEEVLKPTDMFKAFTAEDGCRYGLDGCYVSKGEQNGMQQIDRKTK